MKAYKIYELSQYGFEDNTEYVSKYNKAVKVFNNKVRKAVNDVKGDLVEQEDFSEKVHDLRTLRKNPFADDEIEIISRKMPYILYKKNDRLFATIPFWEKTSYEYDEYDITSISVVMEEIEILE